MNRSVLKLSQVREALRLKRQLVADLSLSLNPSIQEVVMKTLGKIEVLEAVEAALVGNPIFMNILASEPPTQHHVTIGLLDRDHPMTGHTLVCTCGSAWTTSLSRQMAEYEAQQHLIWHSTKGN